MRFPDLQAWLAWQETLHPSEIELGLDRLRTVLARMDLSRPGFPVLSVAGTNGKGSTVAFLEAFLRAAGYRTGAYLSPHLRKYNERIRLDGREADDMAICQAFERIDQARDDVSLTYFEFGTAAALSLFSEAAVDVAIMEVGLGGRLDAVNAVDAAGAVVTVVDLDHQEWLGPDRESIGREKAGIFRAGAPAVCADPDPPHSLLETACQMGAPLRLLNRDYRMVADDSGCWTYNAPDGALESLPLPAMGGAMQLGNAAAAIALLSQRPGGLTVDVTSIRAGLRQASLPGRMQWLERRPELVLDVAHNPHAAANLAQCLRARSASGRTLAVLGMYRDKDAAGVAGAVATQVDAWYLAGLDGPRGQTAGELAGRIEKAASNTSVRLHRDVVQAFRAATTDAKAGDRVLVFGSFATVGAVLDCIDRAPAREAAK